MIGCFVLPIFNPVIMIMDEPICAMISVACIFYLFLFIYLENAFNTAAPT